MRYSRLARLSTLTLFATSFATACGDGGGDDPTGDAGADVGADTVADTEGSDTSGVDALTDTIDPGDGSGDTSVACEGICIPGLSAPVTARFDARGVAHLSCANDEDCAAAMGYFHARDRILQMDIRRRLVTGRLAEIVNVPQVLDLDVANRHLYTTFDGEHLEDQVLAAASPEVRAQLEAYARGVNAWIADLEAGRNGAELPREYAFPLVDQDTVAPWTAGDSVAGVLALVESLINLSGEKLANAEIVDALGEDVFNELFGLVPAWPAYTYESFGEEFSHGDAAKNARHSPISPDYLARLRSAGPVLAAARSQLQRTFLDNRFPGRGETGSNNWVVGAARSATGNALLANDPHLSLSQAPIWYLAHIDSKTNGEGIQNTTGVTFAGLPWVILGQNEDVAWGATASYLDLTDVYLETLSDDGNAVIFDGGEVPLVRRDYTFKIFDGSEVTRELLWVPHHGPVLSIDEEAGTAVTLRWAAQEIGADINVLFGLAGTTTVDDARTVLLDSSTLGQNWIVADSSGNIGWFPYNKVPYRTWATEYPNWLPLPGDGSAEWDAYWAYEDLPQAYNPAQGTIATANSDMTGALADGDPTNDGYPPLQFSVDEGFREGRINQLLGATELHTINSLHAIQDDTYMVLAASTLGAIMAAAEEAGELSSGAQALLDAFEGWDYRCTTGLDGLDPEDSPASGDPQNVASARGCLAFHLVFSELRYATYDDEYEAEEWPAYPYAAHMARLLAGDGSLATTRDYFDDVNTADVTETLADAVRTALETSAEYLTDELGADPSLWLWGRLHVLELRADLFDQFGVPSYNVGPFANDGGNYTVDVANITSARDREFDHRSGASMRLVCEMAAEVASCTIQLPGGQSQFRDDPNYSSFFDDYLRNIPYPLTLDFDSVEGTDVTVVAAP